MLAQALSSKAATAAASQYGKAEAQKVYLK
jgi:hypothetical protein